MPRLSHITTRRSAITDTATLPLTLPSWVITDGARDVDTDPQIVLGYD